MWVCLDLKMEIFLGASIYLFLTINLHFIFIIVCCSEFFWQMGGYIHLINTLINKQSEFQGCLEGNMFPTPVTEGWLKKVWQREKKRESDRDGDYVTYWFQYRSFRTNTKKYDCSYKICLKSYWRDRMGGRRTCHDSPFSSLLPLPSTGRPLLSSRSAPSWPLRALSEAHFVRFPEWLAVKVHMIATSQGISRRIISEQHGLGMSRVASYSRKPRTLPWVQ